MHNSFLYFVLKRKRKRNKNKNKLGLFMGSVVCGSAVGEECSSVGRDLTWRRAGATYGAKLSNQLLKWNPGICECKDHTNVSQVLLRTWYLDFFLKCMHYFCAQYRHVDSPLALNVTPTPHFLCLSLIATI